MNHHFTNEMNPGRAARVIDMLRGERLWVPTEKDYPKHGEWLERTEAELVDGVKRAMVMRDGQDLMGVIVYQRDKIIPGRLEIKNVSVDPNMRDRRIAAYLLRQVEVEAIENDFPGVSYVGVDTKVSNPEMRGFLVSQGYNEAYQADLYGSGMMDVVLEKALPLQPRRQGDTSA